MPVHCAVAACSRFKGSAALTAVSTLVDDLLALGNSMPPCRALQHVLHAKSSDSLGTLPVTGAALAGQ